MSMGVFVNLPLVRRMAGALEGPLNLRPDWKDSVKQPFASHYENIM